MSLIELQNVSAGYGKNVILKDFCINIEEGKLVSLLGPSGCGKTTTLRTMAGFIDVLSGKFLFDGKDFSRVPIHKRGFGYVFQSYALFPHLNVFENVAFGLKERKTDKKEIQRRVMEMLERVNLNGFEKRLPAEMSGGQRQRVALAVRWCFSLSCCCWTSLCPIWMRSCAWKCAWRFAACSRRRASPPCM